MLSGVYDPITMAAAIFAPAIFPHAALPIVGKRSQSHSRGSSHIVI
jgi:hypothetical protein